MSEYAKMTPAERAIKEGYGDEDNPAYCDMNGKCFEYEEDAKYVDKIIKENEELKDFSLKVHNFAHGTDWDDKDIVSAMDFDSIIEKIQKDEKELKKENEELRVQAFGVNCNMTGEGIILKPPTREDYIAMIDELKEEISELKSQLEWNIHEVARYSVAVEEEYVLKEKYEELKEENEKKDESIAFWEGKSEDKKDTIKKLKKENEELYGNYQALSMMRKYMETTFTRPFNFVLNEDKTFNFDISHPFNEDIDNIKEQLIKLKEENKKLKEERQESMTILQEANSDIIGDIKKGLTKEKLKKENKKLKEELNAWRIKDNQNENKLIGACREQLIKLKEENEKLKDKVDTHKKASIYEHTSCYEGRMMLVKTLWEKEEDWRERIDLDFPSINTEIEKLKKENKRLRNKIDEEEFIEDGEASNHFLA